jgi:hypothetical protein
LINLTEIELILKNSRIFLITCSLSITINFILLFVFIYNIIRCKF